MSDKLLKVSPTQIEAGRTCLRRWFKSHVEYFKEPQAPSAALGDKVHYVLECYLRDGTPINVTTQEGRIAKAGEHLLPVPGTGSVEGKFTIPVTPVWGWTGKIDWRTLDGSIVIDHKSTSDGKWAKTEEELVRDPQSLIYAFAGLQGSDRQEQQGRWIYYVTKGPPRAWPVDFKFSRAHVLEGIGELREEVEELVTLRRSKFLDLPPNPNSCNKYGKPCPHKHLCTDLDGSSILRGWNKNMKSKEEILAELRSKATGQTAPVLPQVPPQAPPPVVPPLTPVAPEVQATGLVLPALTPEQISQLQAMGLIPAAPAVPQTVTASVPNPAAPVPLPPVLTPPLPQVPPVLPVAPPVVPPAAPEQGQPQEQAQAAKRGPGRPPGSKNKAKGVQLTIPGSEGGMAANAAAGAPIEIPKVEGMVLYVNCIPTGETEYTFFPEISAHTVVDSRSFVGRDNLPALISAAGTVVMPLP